MNTPPSKPFAAQNPYAAGFGGGYATQPSSGGKAPATAPATASGPALSGAAPALPLIFDVSEADFEMSVLDRSIDVPVLLDLWAPWCGPCRALGPILEKLAKAYGGRFVLAKLDTDQAPQISAALHVRSIPMVMLFVGGQPVGQFTGALPEGQVRAFLDQHLKDVPAAAPQGSPVDELRAAAAEAPDDETAEALLREALAVEPGHLEATLDLSGRMLARAEVEAARALLEAVPAADRNDRHTAMAKRIELAAHRPEGDAAALQARIAANSRDFEARFALAALQVHGGQFREAFDQLLEVVLRDKGKTEENWREKARLQLIEWFDLCPDADAVSHGRRYLGMYLN